MIHSALRTIGVIHLEPEAEAFELLLGGFQPFCRLPRENTPGSQVPVNALTHEIVAGEVAEFHLDVRYQFIDINKVAGKVALLPGSRALPHQQKTDDPPKMLFRPHKDSPPAFSK